MNTRTDIVLDIIALVAFLIVGMWSVYVRNHTATKTEGVRSSNAWYLQPNEISRLSGILFATLLFASGLFVPALNIGIDLRRLLLGIIVVFDGSIFWLAWQAAQKQHT